MNRHYIFVKAGWVISTGSSTFIPPGAIEIDVPLQDNHYTFIDGVLERKELPSPFHMRAPGGSFEVDTILAWATVRRERTTLLEATDYKVVISYEKGETLPEAWKEYRQALRDVTEQEDPLNIEWPIPPSE